MYVKEDPQTWQNSLKKHKYMRQKRPVYMSTRIRKTYWISCLICKDFYSDRKKHVMSHLQRFFFFLKSKETCAYFKKSTATHCNTLQHTATFCNTLQHTATRCNTLQRTATHSNALQRTATHCNALQRIATHCNTLQRSKANTSHCNTMQYNGNTM